MELREGYKLTEVGVIPEDWDVKQLRKISPGQSVGLVINPSSYYDDDGTVPMLVGSNIKENSISWESANQISDASNKLISASRLTAGDLVTIRVGEPGITAVVPPELDGCNCASVMIVRKNHSFDSHWLCYVMNSRIGLSQIEHVQYGTAQKQFNIKDAVNFLYPVPSFTEQTAIANALSDADALIQSLTRLIAKKRQIKQGTMQTLLNPYENGRLKMGWVVKKLGDVGATYGGLTGKSKGDFNTGNSFYIPFLNVMNNIIINSEFIERVRVEKGESQNHAKKGDLFFNGSSETPEELGLCAVLDDEIEKLYLNSFCFGFRLTNENEMSGLYLSYYFRSNYGRELLYSMAQGATRYNLSKANFLKLKILTPVYEEQTRIATIFSDMDADIAALETKLAKTQHIKQGMMQNLLTGRIRLVSPQKANH